MSHIELVIKDLSSADREILRKHVHGEMAHLKRIFKFVSLGLLVADPAGNYPAEDGVKDALGGFMRHPDVLESTNERVG